jgi:hypothetical protein
VKGVVPHRGEARRPAYGDPAWILTRQQEVVAIEIDEPDNEEAHDGSDVGILLGEDVIAVLHQPAVLAIGAGLASQTLRTFEQNDRPAAQRQLVGDNHAGEAAADHDGRWGRHFVTRLYACHLLA